MTPKLLIATILLAAASFINVLDSTIVNVSLVHIAGSFGISAEQGTWTITSYGVSEAIFLPLVGWLTTRFGTVRQFVWSVFLFTVASLVCGMAPTYEILLLGRVLQGVLGASMIPLSQTLMLKMYPEDKKSTALTIWLLTLIVAPVMGPLLGGWITSHYSWRWIFYINLPLGIITSLAVYKILQHDYHNEELKRVPVDGFGLMFLILGVGSLQMMLDLGNELDWFSSLTVVGLALSAFVFLTLLVLWEYHHPNPIVNIRVFTNRNFFVGSTALALVSVVFYSGLVAIPLWLQNVLGYSSFESGKAGAPLGVGLLLMTPIIGKLVTKKDPRKMAALGLIILAIVYSYTARLITPDTTIATIQKTRFLTAIGMGLIFIPLNNIALFSVDPIRMASAAGLYSFMRNLGANIGSSIVVPLWNHTKAFRHEQLVSNINTSNPNFIDYMDKLNGPLPLKLQIIEREIMLQSATMGINDILMISAVVALVIFPYMFLANKPKPGVAAPSGH